MDTRFAVIRIFLRGRYEMKDSIGYNVVRNCGGYTSTCLCAIALFSGLLMCVCQISLS